MIFISKFCFLLVTDEPKIKENRKASTYRNACSFTPFNKTTGKQRIELNNQIMIIIIIRRRIRMVLIK